MHVSVCLNCECGAEGGAVGGWWTGVGGGNVRMQAAESLMVFWSVVEGVVSHYQMLFGSTLTQIMV